MLKDIEDMFRTVVGLPEKEREKKLSAVIKHLNKSQMALFSDTIVDYSLQETVSSQHYPAVPESDNLFWGIFIVAFCLLADKFSEKPSASISDFLLCYGLFLIAGLYMAIRALYTVKFSIAFKNENYTMARCTINSIDRRVSTRSKFKRMKFTKHTSVSYYATINGIKVKISASAYYSKLT